MKKAAILIFSVLLLGSVLFSCKSSQKCPAYGEAKRYKVEKPRY